MLRSFIVSAAIRTLFTFALRTQTGGKLQITEVGTPPTDNQPFTMVYYFIFKII
jgi:hypothetical protein